jgi:DNA-binding beta-propeller fold protein YncE
MAKYKYYYEIQEHFIRWPQLFTGGSYVYIISACKGANGRVDLATKTKVDSFKAGDAKQLSRLKFSKDGKYLLGTDNWPGGDLVIIDVATKQVVKKMALGQGAEAIFIEPDGRHVLVGVTGKDNVAEVDLQTFEITRRIETGQGPDGMAWVGN